MQYLAMCVQQKLHAMKALHAGRCLHEIQAVAGLPQHPNVVGQYRAWQQGGHFYIQMDLCSGGSLSELLRQVPAVIGRYTVASWHFIPNLSMCTSRGDRRAHRP